VKSAKAISDDKAQRLVAWNTDVLARLLSRSWQGAASHTAPRLPRCIWNDGKTVLDEVRNYSPSRVRLESASNQDNLNRSISAKKQWRSSVTTCHHCYYAGTIRSTTLSTPVMSQCPSSNCSALSHLTRSRMQMTLWHA
jgi:hypothetical protein